MSNNSDVVGCLGQVRYDIIQGNDLVFGKSSMYFSTTISNRYDVGGLAQTKTDRFGPNVTDNNRDSMKFPLDRYDVMLEFDTSVLTPETWTVETSDAMTYRCFLARASPR